MKYSLFILFLSLHLALGTSLQEGKQLLRTTYDNIKANFSDSQPVRDLECFECRLLAEMLDIYIWTSEGNDELVLEYAIEICIDYDLYPADVCRSMVYLSGHEVVYVIHETKLSFEIFCGWLVVGDHCKNHDLPPWTLEIPSGKPTPSHPVPDPNSESIKVLHLSDLHTDHLYEVGAPAVCDHPLCCRTYVNITSPPDVPKAGKWGDYSNCDIPVRTLVNGVQQAAKQNPDIVYVTGDLPPHDVWMQSRETIITSIQLTLGAVKDAFPNTPVMVSLGNHESAPVNSFVVPSQYEPSGWNMDWLYGPYHDILTSWLPEDTTETLLKGGFFATSPFPGLRVISLNMNYCHDGNWWLIMQNVDPVDELDWLMIQLLEAEAANEKVHILGHVPPASCEKSWSHVFNNIVTRFESTISALFFGHTHDDQWEIHFDSEEDTRPVAISYIAPALTTFGERNPSFRIYTVDGGYSGATYTVMETETFRTNLSIANSDDVEPEYYLDYVGSEFFGMSAFTPEHWADMTWEMATNDDLFHNFIRTYYSMNAEPAELETCTASCRKSILCGMYKADSSNSEPCQRIQDAVVDVNSTLNK